jgi:hypothetical protein
MNHKCRKCGFEASNPEGLFFKDRRLEGGYAHCCRVCVRKMRAELFYNRRLSAHRSKAQARKNAQAKWGHASQYPCSVLDCRKPSEELHHVDYGFHESVVPMCSAHHQRWHTLQDWEKAFENDEYDGYAPKEVYALGIMTKKNWP